MGRDLRTTVRCIRDNVHELPSRLVPARTGRKEEYLITKQYLLASDFDQTLSFNDSGVALAELIGFHDFHNKVKGLANLNLVQQGAELSYLILHDPGFRKVRREDLIARSAEVMNRMKRAKKESAIAQRRQDPLPAPPDRFESPGGQ